MSGLECCQGDRYENTTQKTEQNTKTRLKIGLLPHPR